MIPRQGPAAPDVSSAKIVPLSVDPKGGAPLQYYNMDTREDIDDRGIAYACIGEGLVEEVTPTNPEDPTRCIVDRDEFGYYMSCDK